jgi:hypothetical protein
VLGEILTNYFPARKRRARGRGGSAASSADLFVISARDNKAEFTEAGVGNNSATLESSTTTFDFSFNRLTYLPRTITPKSDLLYSGRKSSAPDFLAFFIDILLSPRRLAATDEADSIASLNIGDNQEPPRG